MSKLDTVAPKHTRSGVIDSENVEIVNAVTPASEATNSRGVEIDNEKIFSTAALDDEKFMRDELTVFLADAMSENDSPFVEITVNGDYKLAHRGVETKMKRYHVAVLAQAKQARLRQTKIVQPDGSMGYKEDMVASLTYPFQITHDPDLRRGSPWLKQILSNPV